MNLLSENKIDIPVKGGLFSIEYELKNPSDLHISVICEAEWITDIDYKTQGFVTFEALENTSSAIREDLITVTYGDLSFSVQLMQEGVVPELRIVSDTDVAIPFAGGDYDILYEITTSADDCQLSVKNEDEWITDIDKSADGIVKIHVGENTTAAKRTGTITLGYGTCSETITINQEKKKTGMYDEEMCAADLDGFYYGDAYSPGAGNYWFFLSDKGLDEDGNAMPDGTFFRIDLYGEIADDPDNARIPVGTYVLDSSPYPSCAAGTFSRANSAFFKTDEYGKIAFPGARVFNNGTLTISETYNGYLVELVCTINEENIVWYAYYNGDTILQNYAE